MKRIDWAVPERVCRVTVRLDQHDTEHMEDIRRNVLGRRGSVRIAMSYADTIRYALAVAAAGSARTNDYKGAR